MAEKKEIIKEYSNKEITVIWKPNSCIHSKKCWKGLIEVFNPKNKPWVNMDGASSNAIKSQVDACPSGALSYTSNNASKRDSSEIIDVQCLENGPLMIKGTVKITHSNGTLEVREKTTAFCRCGASENKPFCDGAHRKIDFKA
ncbi:(4Fe-4S)-binding protein [uncultured Polaribacter sp.]|uniref:(4Fe-4S)-binding protein n=1 Tax=uncultured Polaribacter sp. TaxID=174711 RepID=UPI002605C008|nr:(4Fe-4S)-binding protein [uncultured Polaribacter sp.]